jgi:hypothetical protein
VVLWEDVGCVTMKRKLYCQVPANMIVRHPQFQRHRRVLQEGVSF